ncbi:MAG: hypothetical protein JJE09_06440, partial [Bacteroidia bacterium]|nr:hypothetical protein [Bacteroidia bacterium]
MSADIDKFRVIFRWISENIEYDIKLYLKTVSHDYDPKFWPNKAARWSKRLNRLYTRHTIKQRISICEGYSWLLETMCRTVGVSCEVIHGYARNENSDIGRRFKPNHAWNAVKIDNKWYLSDPTWASGGVNPQFNSYIKYFNEVYFIVNPNDFITNHYPSDARWMFLLEKPPLADFFNAPIMTTAFLENSVVHYSPKTGKNYINRDSVFNFSFTMNHQLESFIAETLTFRNRQSITEILPVTPKQNKEGYYYFSQAFKEKGEYDLRIYINRGLTFIYKVF